MIDFFIGELHKYNEKKVDDLLIFYLANLLNHNMLLNKKIYLVDLYIKASQEKCKEKRIDIVKTLADHSLFMSGFFEDSIFNIQYYIDVGRSSYLEMYHLTNKDIYSELSSKYLDCRELLSDYSLSTKDKEKQMILILSKLNLKSDEVMLNKLRKLGLQREGINES